MPKRSSRSGWRRSADDRGSRLNDARWIADPAHAPAARRRAGNIWSGLAARGSARAGGVRGASAGELPARPPASRGEPSGGGGSRLVAEWPGRPRRFECRSQDASLCPARRRTQDPRELQRWWVARPHGRLDRSLTAAASSTGTGQGRRRPNPLASAFEVRLAGGQPKVPADDRLVCGDRRGIPRVFRDVGLIEDMGLIESKAIEHPDKLCPIVRFPVVDACGLPNGLFDWLPGAVIPGLYSEGIPVPSATSVASWIWRAARIPDSRAPWIQAW